MTPPATPSSTLVETAPERPASKGTRRAARALLPVASGQAMWWWVGAVGLFGVVPAVRPSWLGDDPVSLWQFFLYAPMVGMFILGGVLVTIQLPLYVANGIGRRGFVRAAALAASPAIVANALVGTAGFALERTLLFTAAVEPELIEAHLFASTDQYLLVFVELLVALPTAFAASWLIGGAYYRFGWLRATLAVPLLIVPAFAMKIALTGSIPWSAGSVSTGARVVLALGVLGATAVAVDRMTRDLELHGTSTWQNTA